MSSIPFDATQIYIGGQWQAPATGATLPLFNPSDGSVLTHIARGTAAARVESTRPDDDEARVSGA